MSKYQNITASETATIGTNQTNDKINKLVIIPLTKTPGKVYLKDGTNAAWEIYPGIGNLLSLDNLAPVIIDLGINSILGGWSIITEAHVQVIVIGEF